MHHEREGVYHCPAADAEYVATDVGVIGDMLKHSGRLLLLSVPSED